VLQHLLERAEQRVPAQPGEGQRAPGDTEFDAEGRLVRAVAAHVADHGVHRAVGRAHGVVEVAAEQGAGAAGAVARGEPQLAALQQRPGEQSALQPGVLLRPQARLGELALRQVVAFALDGVADGAGQQSAVQLVADEVVLRADPYGVGVALGVGSVGERQHRVPGRHTQDPPQDLQLAGLGGLPLTGPVVLTGSRGLRRRAAPGHNLAPTGHVRPSERVRPTARTPYGGPVALDPDPAVTPAVTTLRTLRARRARRALRARRAIGPVGSSVDALAAVLVGVQREVQQDAVDIVGEQPCGFGQIARRAHFDRPAALVQHARHAQRACRIVLDHEQGQAHTARALLLGEQGLAGHGL
jgi:hypothetical protein